MYSSVTWLKVRILEPEETIVARQRLIEHGPMAMDTYATTEELLEVVFYMWPMLRLYNKGQWKRLKSGEEVVFQLGQSHETEKCGNGSCRIWNWEWLLVTKLVSQEWAFAVGG
jgi:hypothetical protein